MAPLKRGPRRLAALLDMPASTIHAVLTRHGLHRLARLDRPTGQPIRRYERDRPGELIHIDVERIGRLRRNGETQAAAITVRWNKRMSVSPSRMVRAHKSWDQRRAQSREW